MSSGRRSVFTGFTLSRVDGRSVVRSLARLGRTLRQAILEQRCIRGRGLPTSVIAALDLFDPRSVGMRIFAAFCWRLIADKYDMEDSTT